MRKILTKTPAVVGSGALVIAGTLAMTAPALALSTANGATAASAAASRLDTAKLKICNARQNTIDGILKRVAERGNRHLSLYSDVATRVETFYTKSGKTLSNYSDLVATVNSDKTSAQAAVNQVQTDSTMFSCSGDNPAGTLQGFKTDANSEVTALQNYKASVKALTDGVKSVTETSTTSSGGSQ